MVKDAEGYDEPSIYFTIKRAEKAEEELKYYKQALTKAVSLPKGVLPDSEQYYTQYINGQVQVVKK